MTSRTEFHMSPPQQVYNAYKEIRKSSLILNKTLDENNIAEFQSSLNKSQPSNDEESKTRSLIQYLYRKNPTNFCRFLVRSRLSHMILWTEAKCIVRHFGLSGIVYVKWNDIEYECSLHKNVNHNQDCDIAGEHPSAQKTYNSIGIDLESYSNDNQNERRPREYNKERGGRGGEERRPREYNKERGGRGGEERRPREYNKERGGHGGYQDRNQSRPNIPTNNNDNFPILKNTYDHISESNNTENTIDLTTGISANILEVLPESQNKTTTIPNTYVKGTTSISYSDAVKGGI